MWKEKYPNKVANMIPTPVAETATKLLAAIAANSGLPDASFIQYEYMINFTLRGGQGLADLKPFFEPQMTKWVKWPLDLMTTKDGKMLGHPADIGTTGLFYHRKAMEKAGLKSDPESVAKYFATWDSYLETGVKLAEKGVFLLDDAANMFDLLRSVLGKKEQAYFDDNGEPIVNGDNFVEAANICKKLRQAKVDARSAAWSDEWNTAIKDGVFVGLISAAWWDIILHIIAPESGGTWGVVPTPGGAVGNMGGSYLCLTEASQKKEVTFEFVQYNWGSGEGLTANLKVNRFLPAYKPLYETDFWKSQDPFYANQAWLPIFSDNAEKVPTIRLNINDGVAAEVMTQAVADILDNDLDPKAEFDKAVQTVKDRTKGT